MDDSVLPLFLSRDFWSNYPNSGDIYIAGENALCSVFSLRGEFSYHSVVYACPFGTVKFYFCFGQFSSNFHKDLALKQRNCLEGVFTSEAKYVVHT